MVGIVLVYEISGPELCVIPAKAAGVCSLGVAVGLMQTSYYMLRD